jgi:hypothetical protein
MNGESAPGSPGAGQFGINCRRERQKAIFVGRRFKGLAIG